MRMSCNGCRVLRKGCSDDCTIRPCLQWIQSPESQANATVFLAKFYGRAGLMNLINVGPEHLRPALFRSLLYEACGRIVNPIYGSVGLLWSGRWQMCQNAVEAVLKGSPIVQIASEETNSGPPFKAYDIRHISKEESSSGAGELHRIRTRCRFKRSESKGKTKKETKTKTKTKLKMAARVPRVKLGSQGLEVSAQGLGCMSMSAFYGAPKPEPDMIKLIHHAINSGVTFLDTSDLYGPETNEILLGKAMKGGMREKTQLATKFGAKHENGKFEVQGDPAYVRAACEASLRRLDVDCIDLYYQHRIDTRVPIEITMGELKKLVEEGKIKYVGLSEASASTIRRAHAVHPITAIQLEWSLWSRDVEEEIIPTCRELGIGIVAYSPLGRGFFASGTNVAENFEEGDYRKYLPRFQPENLEHNKKMFDRVNEIASKKGCTTSQLALAWVHHQGNDVVPIPGTTKIKNLEQNIGALSVKLTPEEMAELESIASGDSVKGARYDDGVTTHLDSETPPLSSWKA